jgi:hypothetical protein
VSAIVLDCSVTLTRLLSDEQSAAGSFLLNRVYVIT